MNILMVKVGDKYGPEYVNRLIRGIKKHSTVPCQFFCMTDDGSGLDDHIVTHHAPFPDIKQWNKLFWHFDQVQRAAGIVDGSKCLILDIDQVVIDDIDPILNWPLKIGQVGLVQRWWSRRQQYCAINGGFQMFHAGRTQYLYDRFSANINYWMNHFIDIGHAEGPVNGEQNFIDMHVEEYARSYLPPSWFGKYDSRMIDLIQRQWIFEVSEKCDDHYSPFYCGGEFHPDIRIVHFSNSDNLIGDYDEEWLQENWYQL